MATVEQLKEMLEFGKTQGKHIRVEFFEGVWIDLDAFRKTKNGIQFYRKGHKSGFVREDVFERTLWGKPLKNSKSKQEVSACS